MTGFSGFPKETVTFFQELKNNNNKPWFEVHKPDYLKHIMEPAQSWNMSQTNLIPDRGAVLLTT